MNLIRKIPLPISGLALALLSLGNLLQDIHPILRYTFAAIGVMILILIILKAVLYPQSIREDFKNPVILSSSGTFSMSLMLLSTYLLEITQGFAYTLWIFGIALHIMLMIYFTYHFMIRNFDITAVYPSYWIVYIGITMGAITSHAHQVQEIGFLFFEVGFALMIVTLPLILYRYVRYPDMPDANKPLTCIYTALFSILIVGYINSVSTISNEFVTALYVISCIFYIFSIYKLITYRNLDFYPSFAAFTFPFVISALATKEVATNVVSNMVLNDILFLEMAIAAVLVVYVLVRYVKYLKNS
jgi:exfoliative toxin A/B